MRHRQRRVLVRGRDTNDSTRAALAEYYNGCLCRECLRRSRTTAAGPDVRAFLASQLKRKRQIGLSPPPTLEPAIA